MFCVQVKQCSLVNAEHDQDFSYGSPFCSLTHLISDLTKVFTITLQHEDRDTTSVINDFEID